MNENIISGPYYGMEGQPTEEERDWVENLKYWESLHFSTQTRIAHDNGYHGHPEAVDPSALNHLRTQARAKGYKGMHPIVAIQLIRILGEPELKDVRDNSILFNSLYYQPRYKKIIIEDKKNLPNNWMSVAPPFYFFEEKEMLRKSWFFKLMIDPFEAAHARTLDMVYSRGPIALWRVYRPIGFQRSLEERMYILRHASDLLLLAVIRDKCSEKQLKQFAQSQYEKRFQKH